MEKTPKTVKRKRKKSNGPENVDGAGSFLALPCGSGEIIGRQQLVVELLEFMGRAELAPVQQVHSLADLEQFVDLAALEQLGLDKPYTVDDLTPMRRQRGG